MRVTITLNGTDTNPWEKLGLKQNPFPAIPKAEYGIANAFIAELDSKPIERAWDLESRCKGALCSEEFMAMCLARYQPGERVRFTIEFPD